MLKVFERLRKNVITALLSILTVLGLLGLWGCAENESQVEGFFRYTAGQAYLQVSQAENGFYRVGNSTGELLGELHGGVIRGVTELNDSFFMEVHGDSAIYTIFGIPSVYYRITEDEFEK